MIRPINYDQLTLAQPSRTATKADLGIVNDLRDTLTANADRCVGMAANMIGVNVRIIIAATGPLQLILINPQITAKQRPFTAQEGCLSLRGERSANRFETITVHYRDAQWQIHTQTFTGFLAQIIQHEIDHCNGILI
ncbi:peptide deformylase [Lacticaseibacillus sp. GG6-2]